MQAHRWVYSQQSQTARHSASLQSLDSSNVLSSMLLMFDCIQFYACVFLVTVIAPELKHPFYTETSC